MFRKSESLKSITLGSFTAAIRRRDLQREVVSTPAAAPSKTSSVPFRFQPLPIATLVGDLAGVTAISRQWVQGDTRRCRLCPTCTADHDTASCLVLTEEKIPDSAAEFYSCHAGEWVAPCPSR